MQLQEEAKRVSDFTDETISQLCGQLRQIRKDIGRSEGKALTRARNAAEFIGQEAVALEKYVNLNQMGFIKIVKKHDKKFPEQKLWPFYMRHMGRVPWGQAGFREFWSLMSSVCGEVHVAPPISVVHTDLKASYAPERAAPSTSGRIKSTFKYWVHPEDVGAILYQVLLHLPEVPRDGAKSMDPLGGEIRHTLALDNGFMELYHGRLYLRPNTCTVKLRWSGEGDRLTLTRKTYREGWKGRPNIQESCQLPRDRAFALLNPMSSSRPINKEGPLVLDLDPTCSIDSSVEGGSFLYPGGNLGTSVGGPSTFDDAPGTDNMGIAQGPAEDSVSKVGKVCTRANASEGMAWDNTAPLVGDAHECLADTEALLEGTMMRDGLQGAMGNSIQDSGRESPPPGRLSRLSVRTGPGDRLPPQETSGDNVKEPSRSVLNRPSPFLHPPSASPMAPSSSPGAYWSTLDPYAKVLYDEVQALMDRKQLKPMLYCCWRHTSFQMPLDDSVTIHLETDMTFQIPRKGVLEGSSQISSTSAAGSTYVFPYAVLKVVLRHPPDCPPPAWVSHLMDSSTYLGRVDDFSKFVHGCAVLWADRVQAVPFWVDDPLVEYSMGQHWGRQGPGQCMSPTWPQSEADHDSLLGSPSGRLGSHTLATVRERVQRSLSHIRHRYNLKAPSSGPDHEPRSPLASLLHYTRLRRPSAPVMMIEVTDLLQSEAIMIRWMQLAVIMGSVGVLLLGFAAWSKDDPTQHIGLRVSEVSALLLLPLATIMAGYAVIIFRWRSSRINDLRTKRFDDRLGPVLMTGVVVVGLLAIGVMNVVDIWEVHKAKKHHKPKSISGVI